VSGTTPLSTKRSKPIPRIALTFKIRPEQRARDKFSGLLRLPNEILDAITAEIISDSENTPYRLALLLVCKALKASVEGALFRGTIFDFSFDLSLVHPSSFDLYGIIADMSTAFSKEVRSLRFCICKPDTASIYSLAQICGEFLHLRHYDAFYRRAVNDPVPSSLAANLVGQERAYIVNLDKVRKQSWKKLKSRRLSPSEQDPNAVTVSYAVMWDPSFQHICSEPVYWNLLTNFGQGLQYLATQRHGRTTAIEMEHDVYNALQTGQGLPEDLLSSFFWFGRSSLEAIGSATPRTRSRSSSSSTRRTAPSVRLKEQC
jgi:hypothetical protein